MSLSPAETAFVDALIETGEPQAAAVIANVQPALAVDPRIQSALVDRIQAHGAVDAVYARKVLYDLAKTADLDSVRLNAAKLLWERGLGKTPDQVNVNVQVQSVPRDQLYTEIKSLIAELGLPPAIEGEFTELPDEAERSEASPRDDPGEEAGVAHGERERVHSAEVAGSTPAAGTYTPDLPPKWR